MKHRARVWDKLGVESPCYKLLHPMTPLAALALAVELNAAMGTAVSLALHDELGSGTDAHALNLPGIRWCRFGCGVVDPGRQANAAGSPAARVGFNYPC